MTIRILILSFLMIIAGIAKSQEDTSRYNKFPSTYGIQYPSIWANKVLRVPSDTFNLNQLSGALATTTDGNPYWWNGTKWVTFVKYADSLVKYVTPTQLKAYSIPSLSIVHYSDIIDTYTTPTLVFVTTDETNANQMSIYLVFAGSIYWVPTQKIK